MSPLCFRHLVVVWCCITAVQLLAVPETVAAGGAKRDGGVNSEKDRDRVTELPGQPKVSFKHYSGYVKIRPKDEKALFYWFFEAQDNVPNRPLVLWLNGGPGCSSVAYGALQELGPFIVQKNGSHLLLNKYSWNTVANIIFVEAPIGVGFSYTNNTEDLLKLGDQITAADSYDFLLSWFNKFPEFKSHDFYLTGESYAGHYVPQLADLIHERNKGSNKRSFINLKGFMIGNAVINDPTDQQGLIDYAWTHAIISDEVYNAIKKHCDFKSNKPNIACSIVVKGFLQAYSDIDIYNIYAPVCLASYKNSTRNNFNVSPRLFSQHELWQKLPSGSDPCMEEYVDTFLNRKDVQKALHANVTRLSYPYTTCSNVIKKWNDSPDTVLPTIEKLMSGGLRIWIFSGDTDGRVPVTATRYGIKEMKLKIKEEWRAWFNRHQVGGWVVTYMQEEEEEEAAAEAEHADRGKKVGGLSFVTVRGAGHQVPMFAPQQSLSLFSHFLSGTPLPSARF